MHPRSKHWYIIVKQKDFVDVKQIKSMLGANCWSEFQQFKSKMFCITPKDSQKKQKKSHNTVKA